MINRLQHLMILCLYTLFSIFLGIVFITLSDSFYVGAGSFFAFFLSFVCYHIFWFGRKITSRMSNMASMIHTLDNNKDVYTQDLKSVRDIINNVTEIIDTIITNNDTIQEDINKSEQKYHAELTLIEKKIHALESQTNPLSSELEILKNQIFDLNTKIHAINTQNHELMAFIETFAKDEYAPKTTRLETKKLTDKTEHHHKNNHIQTDFTDSFIEDIPHTHSTQMLNVRSVKNEKAIYDVSHDNETQKHNHIPSKPSMTPPEDSFAFSDDNDDDTEEYNFSDDFYTAKQSDITPPPNNNAYFDENSFLNSDDDDSFVGLTLPKNMDLRHNKPVIHDTENEFATIDQTTTEAYSHLLENDHDETFYETIDDLQTKTIREQLDTQNHTQTTSDEDRENDAEYESDDDDDESQFVDVTHDTQPIIPQTLPKDFTSKPLPHIEAQTHAENIIVPKGHSEHKESIEKDRHIFIPNMASVPSLTDLMPDDKLKNIIKNRNVIKNTVPALDSLLRKPFAKKQNHVPKMLSDNQHTHIIPPKVSEETPEKISETIQDSNPTDTPPIDIIDIIRTAIQTDNVALLTCPVTDNRIREVKFVENYIVLPTAQQNNISWQELAKIARKQGMGIALDTLMIMRSIKLLPHLKETITDVCIFCNISLLSLIDTHFENELYALLNNKRAINQHLIFQFPQHELETLHAIHIEKIIHLTDMGIRFCMGTIQNVLPDLSELSRIGISFIKIYPADFMNGIYVDNVIYKGTDIKTLCHNAGILLCVDAIDTHQDLLNAVENQADLLQGDLLGEKEPSELLEIDSV